MYAISPALFISALQTDIMLRWDGRPPAICHECFQAGVINYIDIKIPWQAYVCIGAALTLTEVAHRLWQATFLEIGSASRFMRLEKKEHITLWNAILRSDLDTFSQVKEKLLLCTELLVFMLLQK